MRFDVSDTVRLATAVELVTGSPAVLADRALGTVHELNPTAAELVALMSGPGGARFQALVDHMDRRYGVPASQAHDDLGHLLASLDRSALIDVRRSPARFTPQSLVGHAMSRRWWDPQAQPSAARWSCSPIGLLRAVAGFTRVPLLVYGLLAGLFFLALGAIHPHSSQAWRLDATGYLAVLPSMLLWSLYWHELGHIVVLPRAVRDRAILVVRGWRMAILHRGTPPELLPWVAAAGPLLTFVATCALWPLSLLDGLQLTQAFALAPWLAATHLLSLLPFAADGRMIRRSLERGGARPLTPDPTDTDQPEEAPHA